MACRSPFASLLVVTVSLAPLVGCSSEPEVRPLGPDQFIGPADRGGAVVPNAPTPPLVPPEASGKSTTPREVVRAARGNAPANDAQPAPTQENVDFVGRQAKPLASAADATTRPATTAPALAPQTKPPEYAPGQFLQVGGIIAEVNGAPIYADDVLRAVSPVLVARAKELDRAAFRNLAATEINRQTDEMIRAAVAFASAERNTTAEEKQMAERMTEQWRDKLITENKGSIEEARRKVRESGRSFEELAKDEYRLSLVRVYYTRKLLPRIQVTADDLRRFYDKNKGKLFTERESATFRLIKISPKDMGSDAKAKEKIDELAARAQRGEEFATIAGEINHDAMLLRNKGLLGPIDRGAFKLEAVENALWKINQGETTPVIKVGDDYYLAKLEDKKIGRTMAFEEDAVQKRMNEQLRGEQLRKMQADLEQTLRKESVIDKKQPMVVATVEMAMQNYNRWRE